MLERRTARRRSVLLIVYVIVLATVCAWTVVGGSMLFLMAVVLLPPLALIRSRMPLSASLALLLVVFAWSTLVVFVIARYTHIPPLVLVIALGALVGVFCALRLRRRGTSLAGVDAADLGFTGIGGLAWCGVILVAAVVPGGSPISWAMSGDAANNVLFARSMLADGGVSLGGGGNPVPMTTAMLSLFTLPGTAFGPPTVEAQIIGLTQMWSFGIVASCVMCGALALALTKRRSAMSLVAVGLSSLLPLCWMLLSGPVVLGFVNFHLTLALLCASLVTLVHASRAVLTSFVTIALAVACVLALWAPLVGIPGMALVVLSIVHRRRLLALTRGRLALAVVALLQPLLLFVTLSLPSLLNQGSALEEASGAVFDFKKILLVIVFALAVITAVLHVRISGSPDAAWVLIAVAGGGGICLAGLLWLRRNEENIWSYYQLKFLWFLIAVLLIVGVATGLTLASSVVERHAVAALTVIAVLGTAFGVNEIGRATVPTFSDDVQTLKSPLVRILMGDFYSVGRDDRVFHRVVDLLESGDKAILWESSDPDEDYVMFWVTQMSSSGVDDVDLRIYAYYHDGQSMDDLCTMRELMGPPVTVITKDPDIARRAEEACGDLGPIVLEQ